MRMWRLGVALLALAGCLPETQLQPRPEAQTLAGEKEAAVAEHAGVRLVADGAAWKGHPGNLERRLTPVEVRLENLGDRPVRVRYIFFDLVGGSQFKYAALPPLSLEEAEGSEPVCVAQNEPLNWGNTWGWRGPSTWRQPWWQSPYYDPFYDPYYPRPFVRCDEPLPTQDMLDQALPEGVLEPGGTIAGFLYFQGVSERERLITLEARLVDARTGEEFGKLNIPFEVR